MLSVYVDGIGLCGPGLADWNDAARRLALREPYSPAKTVTPQLSLLPPAERRRTTNTIRLALGVAQAAFAQSGQDPAGTATVFASSGGDGETIHAILDVLNSPTREVSPTRFHNSVHNAPAGYWAIATGSRAPSTTLCAHDWSFAAGLLEAAAQIAVDQRAAALVVYDLPYPEPLNGVRPITDSFGVAFVLAPTRSAQTVARLDIAQSAEPRPETRMKEPTFERLRSKNPAARCLPLLRTLARGGEDSIVLQGTARRPLVIDVRPFAQMTPGA